MIFETAKNDHKKELMRKTLYFTFNFNQENDVDAAGHFALLPNNRIRFRGSTFNLTKTHMSMVLNEMMKNFIHSCKRPISQVRLTVSNFKGDVFHTQLPRRIQKPICARDMYDYDMCNQSQNIAHCFDTMWLYIYKFRKSREISTNT